MSRAFLRDARGGATIEFALLLPVLVFAIVATLQIGIMGITMAALNNAVLDASRQIRTGRPDGPTSVGTFKTLVCSEFSLGGSECGQRLTVNVLQVVRFSDLPSRLNDQMVQAFDKGEPGDIILVRVNYRMPLIVPVLAIGAGSAATGPMEVMLDSRTTFKNEPYAT